MQHPSKNLGFVQWFPFADHERVEETLDIMRSVGVRSLRTCLSWADWERPHGPEWFDWVFRKITESGISIFPSLFYTPQCHACLPPGTMREDALTAFPPQDPQVFVEFLRTVVRRYDEAFHWIGLWNEPNNLAYWRADLDPQGSIFRTMMLEGLSVVHKAGKKGVIGSLVPPYAPWLKNMREAGVLEQADAIGIHDFPGTWNDNKRVWLGWQQTIAQVRSLIFPDQEIWITETGYSTETLEQPTSATTRLQKEGEQERYFLEMNDLAEQEGVRVYWYSVFDQPPGHVTDNEACRPNRPPHDPRADGLGILTYTGKPKRLFTALSS